MAEVLHKSEHFALIMTEQEAAFLLGVLRNVKVAGGQDVIWFAFERYWGIISKHVCREEWNGSALVVTTREPLVERGK
jgi:hypothetical protein